MTMDMRKIAFIHGENTSVTQRRLAGFHKACDTLGLTIPNNYIKQARYHDPQSSGLATRELLKQIHQHVLSIQMISLL